MMMRVRHIAYVLLLLLFPTALLAQEVAPKGDRVSFFKHKAWEDAKNEQELSHIHSEDERDYWNDQRNFEKALKKYNYYTYQAYINEKKQAYTAHEEVCDTSCSHGSLYHDMGAFYQQYGTVKPYLDLKETVSEEISAVGKKKKH